MRHETPALTTAAVVAWAEVLGRDFVVTDADALAPFERATFATTQRVVALDCSDRNVNGEVRFRLFTRMLLSEDWRVSSFSINVEESASDSKIDVLRKPLDGTRNLWTEILIKTPERTRVFVTATIVAKGPVSSGPILTCGPGNPQVFRDPPAFDWPGSVIVDTTLCASS